MQAAVLCVQKCVTRKNALLLLLGHLEVYDCFSFRRWVWMVLVHDGTLRLTSMDVVDLLFEKESSLPRGHFPLPG